MHQRNNCNVWRIIQQFYFDIILNYLEIEIDCGIGPVR